MSRLSRAGGTRKVPARYAELLENSTLLTAGIRAHRKGLMLEALRSYRLRLEEAPDCLDAWMNLGTGEAQAGRATEAKLAFGRAAELAPDNARVFRDVGLGLKTIGYLPEAVSAFERSVQCQPDLVGSWLHLARTRLEVAPRAMAIDAAQRAVQLRPEDPSSLLLLARCLSDAEPRHESLAALQRAQLCPEGCPEAGVFEWLLTNHEEVVDSSLTSDSDLAGDLAQLVDIHPRLSALADAAAFVWRDMSEARLFSSTRDILRFAVSQAPTSGTLVELGVFHGVSLRWLVECWPGAVHGFDSFVGLPIDWASVPEGTFTTSGRQPEAVGAEFWIGLFEEQLPLFVSQHPEPIALLHIDSDLYESARSGLAHLAGLLVPGTVLVFDEYLGHRSWRQDEYRAFQEAAEHNGWHYEYLAVNLFTGQTVIRLLANSHI